MKLDIKLLRKNVLEKGAVNKNWLRISAVK
jgi:hypothetical protein